MRELVPLTLLDQCLCLNVLACFALRFHIHVQSLHIRHSSLKEQVDSEVFSSDEKLRENRLDP